MVDERKEGSERNRENHGIIRTSRLHYRANDRISVIKSSARVGVGAVTGREGVVEFMVMKSRLYFRLSGVPEIPLHAYTNTRTASRKNIFADRLEITERNNIEKEREEK